MAHAYHLLITCYQVQVDSLSDRNPACEIHPSPEAIDLSESGAPEQVFIPFCRNWYEHAFEHGQILKGHGYTGQPNITWAVCYLVEQELKRSARRQKSAS